MEGESMSLGGKEGENECLSFTGENAGEKTVIDRVKKGR